MLHSTPSSQFAGRRHASRRGVTLVEMLVSVTLTLLVVFAIVQVFDLLGETMAKGRATIEMAGSLRAVSNRLQADLDNITCPVKPWLDPAAGQGYFKYIEGVVNPPDRGSDRNAFVDANGDGQLDSLGPDSTVGDTDDVLMLTARSENRPFTGRSVFGTIESTVAEVIWWVTPSAGGSLQLHRRALLIRPDLNNADGFIYQPGTPVMTPAQMAVFLGDNDISVRVVVNNAGEAIGLAANSLSDLTTPRNRFGHFPLTNSTTFIVANFDAVVYELDSRYLVPLAGQPHLVLSGTRQGDDVMMSDMLAFDVKAYDPEAPLDVVGNVAVAPHEPGYRFSVVNANLNPAAGVTVPFGAFVDLNYLALAPANPPLFPLYFPDGFAEGPNAPYYAPVYVAYDTWSLELERDGLDQNDSGVADEGQNGIDDVDIFSGVPQDGVDDVGERETSPPYDLPLAGIEVKIRTVEYGTQQVRQVSVVGDFSD